MLNKSLAVLACMIVVSFIFWLVSLDIKFEKECFEKGGLTAHISGDKYCVPKDTELLMKY